MPDLHSTAGRHAADLARSRAAANARRNIDEAQEAALARLLRTYRVHGFVTYPHFSPDLDTERSLWVECHLATVREDHARIHAILDDQGWTLDRERLSRSSARYDVLRLTHKASGAKLALIVKIPTGLGFTFGEAA